MHRRHEQMNERVATVPPHGAEPDLNRSDAGVDFIGGCSGRVALSPSVEPRTQFSVYFLFVPTTKKRHGPLRSSLLVHRQSTPFPHGHGFVSSAIARKGSWLIVFPCDTTLVSSPSSLS